MLLSICMIVKNEEKYLRRCLEAVKPVLDQVDSELIIADTGSEDGTVAIAKEYTEHVFHFEWCNDFAAARNAALKRAKSKWLMTLDGDEVFEDVTELIKFFNSGEYQKFNSATFIIKNFRDEELTQSTVFNGPRLTRRTENTHYVNAIHESLTTFGEPIKMLPVIADHFGYISGENGELIKQKSARNLGLLFEQLKLSPDDYICLFNICETYFTMEEYRYALEYCRKGLEAAVLMQDTIRYSFFFIEASIYHNTNKNIEALSAIDAYFRSKDQKIATDLEMQFMQGNCHYRLKNHRKAIASYLEYLKSFEEFREGLLQTIDTMHHSINFTDDDSLQYALIQMTDSFISIDSYETAMVEVSSIFNHTKSLKAPVKELIQGLSTMNQSLDFSKLTEYFQQTDENYLVLLQNILEKAIEDEKYRDLILNEFAGLGAEMNGYFKLMKLRYDFCRGSLTVQGVERFLEEAENWQPYYADVIYFAVHVNCSARQIAEKIDLFNLPDYIRFNKYLHFKDLPLQVKKLCGSISDIDDPINNIWLAQLIYSVLPLHQFNEEEIIFMCQSYARAAYKFAQAAYKEEVLKEESALIPKSIRAGIYLHEALFSQNTKRKADYIRKTVRLCPELSDAAKIVLSHMQRNADKAKHENETSEFDRYASIVKSNIITLINQGKIDDTLQLISQYEQLCPADMDLAELKRMIRP